MNNQIVDLILPDTFDKEKAKKDLDLKYAEIYHNSRFSIGDGWLGNNAREYISELEVIETSQPKYDRTFWEQVIELNKDNFSKIAINLKFDVYGDDFVYFQDSWVYSNWKCSPYINISELDLINKQYRLLQEIYYSRLEKK